jgi:hypothetical protein
LRVQGLQLGADAFEGLRPGHLEVAVAPGVPLHRHRQAAARFEFVVGPAEQFGDRMGLEEFRRQALGRELPRSGLGAVLAELGRMRVLGLGPGAAHAGEAARLVLLPQRQRAGDGDVLAQQVGAHGLQGTPSAGRVGVRIEMRFVGHNVLRLCYVTRR